jgi:spore germination protein KB
LYQDTINDKQKIAVIVLYIIGTSSLVIFSLEAKKDLWLSILICYLMSVLMALMIARIKYLFPEQDLFQIFEKCFGKALSKVMDGVYILSAFYVVVLINAFLIHFIRVTALPNTPKVFLDIFVTFICIWMVKGGVELICNFATFFLVPALLSIVIMIIALFPQMHLGNLLPPFQESAGHIFHGALSNYVFPLGEAAIYAAFFKRFNTPKSSYKVLLTGVTIGALLVFAISVSTVLVLGVNLASDVYYPTYVSAARIMIGTYVHGFELVLSVVFILGAFVKTNVYFTVCCKAIARTFGFQEDYQFLITPVGLLIFGASLFFFEGPLDYTAWLKTNWVGYAFPYTFIVPTLTYIVVEVRKNKIG